MSDHSGQKEWEKGEVSVMTNKLLLKSVIKRSSMALEVGVVRIERMSGLVGPQRAHVRAV